MKPQPCQSGQVLERCNIRDLVRPKIQQCQSGQVLERCDIRDLVPPRVKTQLCQSGQRRVAPLLLGPLLDALNRVQLGGGLGGLCLGTRTVSSIKK